MFWRNADRAIWCTFDPPYRDAWLTTYGPKTIDYPGLVKTLLKAEFRWMLSEYEGSDGMYRALGGPIRIPVWKSHYAGGTGKQLVNECLWTNFELPQCLTEERIKKQMPVVDTAKLIETLENERAEIDAAIRALQRTVARNFPPPPAKRAAKKSAAKADAPKKKGRIYTPAQKAEMSEKLRAAWRKRKGEGDDAAMSQKVKSQKVKARKKRKGKGGEAAAMAAKA